MEAQILAYVQQGLAFAKLTNKYLLALAIIVVFAILAKLVLFIFKKYLDSIAKKTKTKFDDLLMEYTKGPIFYLVLLYGVKLALQQIWSGSTVSNIVHTALAIVFILIISRTLDAFLESWGHEFAKKTKTNIDEVLLPMVYKSSKVIAVIVAGMWILDIWGVDITPYLAGVGVSGLVLGMALQDSLKNIFGGVTLILDKTFQKGDKIKLESGEVGTIHDIGLRSTKLITFDNEIIYIPNGYLANSRVQNYTRPSPKVRTSVLFGVEYGSDVAQVRKVVLEAIRKMKGVMKDPEPSVIFFEMGDSALQFKASFWVENWNEAFSHKIEATEQIYNALGKANINIPFPTRTVYTKQ